MMKSHFRPLTFAILLGSASLGSAQTIFTESFEAPDVSTSSALIYGAKFDMGELPSGGKWIGSTQGTGANREGLINKAFGDYTAPSGNEQGFYFAYSNSGLTTSTSAITETLALARKYTLKFDVARDNGVTSSNYTMQLVAFSPTDTDALRADCRSGSRPGVVLASASGSVTSNDMSKRVTIQFEANAVTHAAHLGKTLGIRFLGNSTLPILDNVDLSVLIYDSDGDGLKDEWEMTYFGNLSHDGTADPDNDKLTNSLELKLGLNPSLADTNGDGLPDWAGLPGYLSIDVWNNIPGNQLADLYGSSSFCGTPTNYYHVTSAKSPTDLADDYGLRMRGTVTAPVTGNYTFWLAGGGECVLYLSTDATPFKRRPIATVATATGVEQWDQFPSQKSATIALVAGQQYHIEALMKAGTTPDHLAVAWQYTGQTRQVIPTARIKSFVPSANDLDDDGMLDSWESTVGLDANDNGATDPNQNGYIDADEDGLLNFEEYQYGGKPFQVGGNVGHLEFDLWTAIPGASVSEFVKTEKYASVPDMRTWLNSSTTTGWGADFGGRMRGTVTPAITGDYRFYVAGDESVELWLSPTSSRFDKRRIAWSRYRTSYQDWNDYTPQRSEVVHLEAGQSYYIEALVKNSLGSNHLSIGWAMGDIPQVSWTNVDIGTLPQTSNWTGNEDSASVSATGGDVWTSADNFTFRYAQLTGDCTITARIPSIVAQHEWAKVGVMIRESLTPGSKNAMALRTGNGRLVYQLRNTTNANTSSPYRSDPGQPNQWLRIARSGNVLAAFTSPDGIVWTQYSQTTITMNATVYAGIAVSGIPTNNQVQATIDQISYAISSSIALIPSSALISVLPDPNDLDDDNLPDDWEQQVGLDPATASNGMGQYGDPDGDKVNNFDEYRYGANPLQNDGIAGNLTRELWENQKYGSIHDFVRSSQFRLGPQSSGLLAATEYRVADEIIGFGQRVRGCVVAPVTGNYRFWISGTRDFELWLSSDATKFNKRKIASAMQWNGGVDMQPVLFREWDAYSCQASKVVHLEAGQKYFIEVLHKDLWGNGHFSVAWNYTDGATGVTTQRDLVTSSQLRTYVADANDADDDYLPDSWETTYGLNPSDNGYGDAREGEYGDYDNDQLSNHEEWLLGTNPNNTDSDGDGFTDYREITFYGSDPTAVDISPATQLSQVSLNSFTQSSGDWYANADGSVSSSVRRGYVTYNVEVAEAGICLLEIKGRAEGVIRPVAEMPVVVFIDDIEVGSYTLRSLSGGQGLVELLTPWLSAGSHTVKVLSDNHVAGRRLRIDSLRLLDPAGLDANNDGTPDWVSNQLNAENLVTVCPSESLVSPVCLEGSARYFEQLSLSSDGEAVQAIRGTNNNWYANVSLAAAPNESIEAKALNFSFEGGHLGLQESIFWKETDVLTAADLTIRKGDSLRFTGLPGFDENGNANTLVTLTIDGVPVATEFNALQPVIHAFDTAGVYNVEVVCQEGTNQASGSMTVTVKDAEFGEAFHVMAESSRIWELPNVGEGIYVDTDSRMAFFELSPNAAGNRRFQVDPAGTGEKRVIARTEINGPIIDFGQVFGYRTYRTDATGDTQIIQTFPNGDRIVMSSIVAANLPPGGYIRLKIFASGVTFLDGTIEKILTAADFDVNGIAYVMFNYPVGAGTSVCHNLTMYDAAGTEIGQQ